jgi:hypothetical protein
LEHHRRREHQPGSGQLDGSELLAEQRGSQAGRDDRLEGREDGRIGGAGALEPHEEEDHGPDGWDQDDPSDPDPRDRGEGDVDPPGERESQARPHRGSGHDDPALAVRDIAEGEVRRQLFTLVRSGSRSPALRATLDALSDQANCL